MALNQGLFGEDENMKTYEILSAIILVIMVGWIWFMASNARVASAATVPDSLALNVTKIQKPESSIEERAGEAITIPIKVVNGYYEPRTITIKQGSRVRLDLDPNTFVGCMSVFNIWGLNLRKFVSANDHVLEFVAQQPGTYRISCNMGMGDGRLIILPKAQEEGNDSLAAGQSQLSAQPQAASPSNIGYPAIGGCGCGAGR
jgi:plastocyanin domain-containing protein